MKDEVKDYITEIRAAVENWPKEQRPSFVNGILRGIDLSAVVAGQAGCNICETKDLEEFSTFLIQNTPPVKRRTESSQKPKPARDQLVDDIKELLRRAIAGRLKMPRPTFEKSLDAEDLINKCLLTVVAIGNRERLDDGNRERLDDAIQDIRIMRSIAGGGAVDRETVKSEVETCYEKFRTEVAGIAKFNEMDKRSCYVPKDIWTNLRANVPVNYGYDDDELATIDSRYLT